LETIRKSNEVFEKSIGLGFGKRAAGSSAAVRKIKKWILWRGRPPPKQKRSRKRKSSQISGSTGHSRSYGPHWRERKREREGMRKRKKIADDEENLN
jgi:hypothetical protein